MISYVSQVWGFCTYWWGIIPLVPEIDWQQAPLLCIRKNHMNIHSAAPIHIRLPEAA